MTTKLDDFLHQRMQRASISSTAMVFTFFCDVVTQHGGVIWLGNIINALAPLGINERLTRTAVYRLVRDGWLKSQKQGRKSYYQLTPTGQNYYQRAADRIYTPDKPVWDGHWTLLFTSLVAEEKREHLRRGLLWLGFGQMATAVYALPRDVRPALNELLADLTLEDSVVCMRARAESTGNLQDLVMSRWKLAGLRQRYSEFISIYDTAWKSVGQGEAVSGHSALLLRILLIHEFRRILLTDPELPAVMLPANWEGDAARSLTVEIYRQLAITSTQWTNSELFNTPGRENHNANILKYRFAE